LSEAWAYLGGALLVAATVPQAAHLLAKRRADDLSWPFVLLNAAGISLLAARSAVIGETAFLAVNLVTASFWGLAAAVKLSSVKRRLTASRAAPEPAAGTPR
jgi:hypothetical protein